MKKLVCLSVVMLFVVVGMAGMANAAGQALATLTGKVTIAGFDYKCENATVRTTLPEFKGKKKTNANGKYIWKKSIITAETDNIVSGTVYADWSYTMFGVELNFYGETPFEFINPIPFGEYTEKSNIEVSFVSH